MSFFQNVFCADFEGNWLLGDRHHIPKFVCQGNRGRGEEVVNSFVNAPYNLSGNDASGSSCNILTIVYAMNESQQGVNFKNWTTLSIDITASAASSSAVTHREIVTALNANTTFNDFFFASIIADPNVSRVMIRSKSPATKIRFYINNGRAEEKMKFNKKAGVAELPTYFARHTMANKDTYTDSQNMLIALAPANAVQAAVINNAVDANGNSLGYSSLTVLADWQLLKGRSGIFDFTKDDGLTNPNTKIVYPAGAIAGDLAKKVIVNAGNTFIIPHVLVSGDLITPP